MHSFNRKPGGSKYAQGILIVLLIVSLVLAGCAKSGSNNGSGQSEGSQQSSGSNAGTGSNSSQNEQAPAAETNKYGGTLRAAVGAQLYVLGDPAQITRLQDLFTAAPALESLARYNSDGSLRPWLAESWEEDAASRTITFKLKKGIKFHDGTDFNAESAKFNIDLLIAAKRDHVKGLQTVEVVDDYTIKLYADPWNSSLLGGVAINVLFVSPATYQANGAEWAALNPVGTGPFVFELWNQDEKVVYKRNDNYWQEGKPYLDSVEIYYMPDPMTASASLQNGEVDILFSMGPETAVTAEKFANVIKLTSGFGATADIVLFNSANPNSPFHDVRVRQAAYHAIDTKAIVDALTYGYNLHTTQWGLPGAWSYNPEVTGYEFNPEKAKQLLAEAGYANGFKTKMATVANPFRQQLLTAVQGYLAAVGIEAEIEVIDQGRLVSMRANRDWEAEMIAVVFRGDADLATYMSFNFDELYGKGIQYTDEARQLIANILGAPDQQTRQKNAHAIQQLLYQDLVLAIPFGVSSVPAAVLPKVMDAGVNAGAPSQWTPEDAWIEK